MTRFKAAAAQVRHSGARRNPGKETAPPLPARTYQLLIDVAKPLRLRIGALGVVDFPAGRYIYSGSAVRNLEARIRRHLSRDKKLRWHIDWLLTAPGVRVVEVRTSGEEECVVNLKTHGTIPVPGFGSSDCRSGCGGHLKFMPPSTM